MIPIILTEFELPYYIKLESILSQQLYFTWCSWTRASYHNS